MSKNFNISARTARQIWRDNFSSADGAIIELVKNTYDADSNISYIYFDVPLFPNLNKEYSLIEFEKILEQGKSFNIDYSLFFQKTLEDNFVFIWKKDQLELIVRSKSTLYIIDNGEWMTEKIIDDYWMTIATDNKKKTSISEKWRVRTWEKWIWRFALDRLWEIGEMYTSVESGPLLYWHVNWADFEKDWEILANVNADFNILTESYEWEVRNLFNYLDETCFGWLNFSKWTILKISNLRDVWNRQDINNLKESLTNLLPPSWIENFKIAINWKDFEEVILNEQPYCEYDYNLNCVFDWKKFKINIHRNEFNLERLPFKYLKSFWYDEQNFERFSFEKEIEELFPSKDTQDIIDLWSFEFNFTFLKKSIADYEKDIERFKYKDFESNLRREWLKKYAWIKIFRDDFKVRPYWENGWASFDWLLLGDRLSKDPSQLTRAWNWKVSPDNVSGYLRISRNRNITILDQSNRTWLIENRSYFQLIDVLLVIIKIFEDDRSTLASHLNEKYKIDNWYDLAKEETEKAIKKSYEESKKRSEKEKERKNWSKEKYEEEYKKKEEEAENAQKAYSGEKEDKERKIDELWLSNTLATKWIIFNSLQHEVLENRNQVSTWLGYLQNILKSNFSSQDFTDIKAFLDPFKTINHIDKHFNKLNEWIQISYTSIRKDRRSSKNINLWDYFRYLQSDWNVFLEKREIIMNYIISEEIFYKWFEIDLDTIFQNLIINSWDAFMRQSWKREINIEISKINEKVFILYSDSGPGLDLSKIKNPIDIFKPLFTTKDIEGTWLWMWLLKTTTDRANIQIRFPEGNWFRIEFSFINT